MSVMSQMSQICIIELVSSKPSKLGIERLGGKRALPQIHHNGESRMIPSPHAGAGRVVHTAREAALATSPAEPPFIVRYRPHGGAGAGPTEAEGRCEMFFQSPDDAREGALQLVRSGVALAQDVAVYADTGWRVEVVILGGAVGAEVGGDFRALGVAK